MPNTHTHIEAKAISAGLSLIHKQINPDTNAQEQDPDAYAQLMDWLTEASKGCNEIEHRNK